MEKQTSVEPQTIILKRTGSFLDHARIQKQLSHDIKISGQMAPCPKDMPVRKRDIKQVIIKCAALALMLKLYPSLQPPYKKDPI